MNEIIQIKCPWCSATLSVLRQKDMESKNVTCPACGQKSPFAKFKTAAAAEPDGCTRYPDNASAASASAATEMPRINTVIGRLLLEGQPQQAWQLRAGRNVVGRKAASSTADIQIPMADRFMSREHLLIDVEKVAGKGYVHRARLFKEKLNATFIGDEALAPGDCIILNHGDRIRLPGATLRFELPDDDATTY